MILNVYSVCDGAANDYERRLGYASTDGAFCRDNVRVDIFDEKSNPFGLPYNDLHYFHVATYE